jgi:ATP-binding cassette subfamily C (CFTR/MRP) protein 1
VAVIGRYGSGKSSIANAILGEMMHEGEASVIINGSLAYVNQKSWVMNASIRNNILFGRTFDSDLYNKVIYYSCLKSDLDILESGD